MRVRFLQMLSVTLVVLALCKSSTAPDGSSGLKAADFRITDQLPGFVQDTIPSSAYREYDTIGLYNIINGGAYEFTSRGMVEGITQNLRQYSGSVTKTINTFVMDFGTAEVAQAMYEYKKSGVGQKRAFTEFAETMAVADMGFSSGCMAYACFGKFYISLNLYNFSDKEEAFGYAVQILNMYREKVK
jgi:hypothetical protein